MLSLLVRRKILRLYRLPPLILYDVFRCIIPLPLKVETQNLASHKRVFRNISARFYGGENMLSLLARRKILRLYRLPPLILYDVFRCIPSLCIKVETQDFASPERAFRNTSAHLYGCENMLSLLVRRKILRLYRLSPLI